MKVVIDGNKTKSARGNRAKELLDHISALFTKEEVIAMLTELKTEIEEYKRDLSNKDITKDHEDFDHNNLIEVISGIIQQKINSLKEK